MTTPSTSSERGKERIPSLKAHFRGHKDSILSLAFHPNLQTVFSSSADGFIYQWSFKKDARALRFEGHCGPVNSVSLSKEGDLMLTSSDDQTVRVWVPTIKGQSLTLKGHSGPIKSACFNPVDSNIFVTGGNDKTIKLWSIQQVKMKSGAVKFKSHDFIQSFTGHTNWIRSVRFSKDGRLIVSSSDDGTIRVFDTRTNECCSKFTCDVGKPLKADFNPCGRAYVGVATTDRSFLLYDIRTPRLVQSYNNLTTGDKTSSVNSFSFHPSGDFVICVGEDAKIKILDLIEGRPTVTLLGPRTAVYDVVFNQKGTLFATGGKDQELLIWEPELIPYPEQAETSKTETLEQNLGGWNKENSQTDTSNNEDDQNPSIEGSYLSTTASSTTSKLL